MHKRFSREHVLRPRSKTRLDWKDLLNSRDSYQIFLLQRGLVIQNLLYNLFLYHIEDANRIESYKFSFGFRISFLHFSSFCFSSFLFFSENRYKHEVLVDGEPILFEILDTCPKVIDLSMTYSWPNAIKILSFSSVILFFHFLTL